jgi:hypothetical protein
MPNFMIDLEAINARGGTEAELEAWRAARKERT